MTLSDLRGISVLRTQGIASACQDPETEAYTLDCLSRFYRGDYGEICQEDAEANNLDLAEGEGHILARYSKAHALESDVYIELYIYDGVAIAIWIMYTVER